MERHEYDRFYKRIKLMAISSLIAIGIFIVATAVWYYEENFLGHFHPHGYLEFCDKGHFVYYLTTALIYLSVVYILIMVPVSMVLYSKAKRSFPIIDKQKKIVSSMTISQGFLIIITPVLIYVDCDATIYAVSLTLLIWLFNSCYLWYCVSKYD